MILSDARLHLSLCYEYKRIAIRTDHTKIRHRLTEVEALRTTAAPFAALRAHGCWSAGRDRRCPREQWGEGLSATHLVFHVRSGEAWPISDPQLRAGAGQLLIIPSHVPKVLSCGDDGVEAVWSHWLGNAQQRLPFPNTLAVQAQNESEALWQVTGSLLRAEAQHVGAIALSVLVPAWRCLHDAPWSSAGGTDPWDEALADLWAQVRRYLEESWDVPRLARTLGVSVAHLHRLVHHRCGHGPMTEVTRLRLERGHDLLREGTQTIAAIARRVGFATPGAFSDAFLRRFGQRPGAVR